MMSAHPRRRFPVHRPLAFALLLLAMVAAAPAAVHVAVQPASIVVEPGEMLEVELTITTEGSSFNGYNAFIGYDPEAISFVERPSSAQEGPLMTEACATRFHVFAADEDEGVLDIAHVLLCAGVSVTGPGVVYRLQFEAGPNDVTTAIEILPETEFYLAGAFVTPILTEDAEVLVGEGTPVSEPVPLADATITVWPNPFNARTEVRLVTAVRAHAGLAIHDLRGAVIRTFPGADAVPGGLRVVWDGTDDGGRRVRSGVYLVTAEIAGRHLSRRVTLVQ